MESIVLVWYGQAEQTPQCSPGQGQAVIEVETISLQELVTQYGDIDYLFMDIQGAEPGFLESGRKFLSRCRTINIGTHSEGIEARLKTLFTPQEWSLTYEVKLNGTLNLDFEGNQSTIQHGDGVQVWQQLLKWYF